MNQIVKLFQILKIAATCFTAAIICANCVSKTDFGTDSDSDDDTSLLKTPIEFTGSLADTRGAAYADLPSLDKLTMWIDNTPYKFQIIDSGKTLKPTTVLYWEDFTESVNFFSCYPVVDTDGIDYTSDKFTITQPADISAQFDFILADKTDVVNGSVVALNYNHKMAMVKFAAAYTASDGGDHTVTVTKVEVNNINYISTITIKDDGKTWGETVTDTDSSTITCTLNVAADTTISKYSGSQSGTIASSYTDLSGSVGVMFIPPQDITSLTIYYTVDDDDEQTLSFETDNAIKAEENGAIILNLVINVESEDGGTPSVSNAISHEAFDPDPIQNM